jgi:hypothetical protein
MVKMSSVRTTDISTVRLSAPARFGSGPALPSSDDGIPRPPRPPPACLQHWQGLAEEVRSLPPDPVAIRAVVSPLHAPGCGARTAATRRSSSFSLSVAFASPEEPTNQSLPIISWNFDD